MVLVDNERNADIRGAFDTDEHAYVFHAARGQDIHVCALTGGYRRSPAYAFDPGTIGFGIQCVGPHECAITYRISSGATPPD